MLCPFCNHDNIEGADECARCQGSLSGFDGAEHTSKIERALMSRRLSEVVTHDYVEVAPDISVRETVRKLHRSGCHCAVVVDEGGIAGIFTERDVLNKLADRFERRADGPVREFMTPDPVTLTPDDPIVFGLNRMMVGDYRHIPLERDGRMVGVVSVRDVLAYLVDHFDEWLPATA